MHRLLGCAPEFQQVSRIRKNWNQSSNDIYKHNIFSKHFKIQQKRKFSTEKDALLRLRAEVNQIKSKYTNQQKEKADQIEQRKLVYMYNTRLSECVKKKMFRVAESIFMVISNLLST